ncbi:MAG: PQQ-binding-like beta-propeller repeat protein [Gemmataceae bacterium]
MWRSGGRLRSRWVWLGIACCLLLGGGVIAFTKMDLERYRSDSNRLRKLATTELSSANDTPNQSAGWPQWRGPNRDGLSPETGLLKNWPASGPPVVWKQPIGRGFSSMAVVNRRLYTMDAETIEPESGETTPGANESVVCLDANTGQQIWRFRYANEYDERFGSGPRSTPAVDGGFVYAVGPTGIFHCLRADTGEKMWRHDLSEEFQARKMQYGVSFSPLVEGDLVYTTPGGPNGNSVAAFDKRTGRLVWKALDDVMGYSSPIAITVAGVRQVLFFTNTALVSLSPEEGRTLWRYPWETDNGFNIATPLAFGDYVFLSSGYGKGCVLLEITPDSEGSPQPHRVYEHNRMRNHFCTSIRQGDHLYGFDQMDLVCMNVRTGDIIWREKGLRSFRKGSLGLADGCLFVLGETGTLTLADATPSGYRGKATIRISENKCWTAPIVAEGKIYVRDESQIVCLNLKE